MKRWLLTLTLLLVPLCLPQAASAQDYVVEDVVLVAAAPIGGLGVVLTVADIAYIDRAMPFEWAVTAITGGSLELVFGVTALAAAIDQSETGGLYDAVYGEDSGLMVAWAALGIGFGALHIAHGIVSLLEPARERPAEVALRLLPRDGGAVVQLAGTF